MTTETDRDRLDDLLATSAPVVPEPSAALRTEARSMIAAAAHGDRHRARRRLSRTAIVGITAASLVGLGGLSAAAATIDQWSWWAQEPDAAIEFTLPSGIACEYRVSTAKSTVSPESVQAIREWASHDDLSAVVDVDQAIQRLREQDFIEVQDDGTEIVGGYGTDHYHSPDKEYHVAVTQALDEAISAELASRDLPDYGSYWGETICADDAW